MKKSYLNVKWFTLTELIVVIVILTILTTIWFVTYQNYIPWTRDANRISQLTTIANWLESYKARNLLPNPENSIEIRQWTWLIYRQWYIWTDILSALEYNKAWIDPKDKLPFTYVVTRNNKNFQLMWYLEEWTTNIVYNPLVKKASAADYTNRYPILFGKKLWVFLQTTTKTPAQDLSNPIDISTTSWFVVYLSTDEILIWSYYKMLPNLSCKRIMESGGNNWNWVYTINPTWTANFDAYCDMTTDWWWWTLVYKNVNADSSFWFWDSIWIPNWSDENKHGIWISNWKDLSTSKAMAKIISNTWEQSVKVSNWKILTNTPVLTPTDSNAILDMASVTWTKKYWVFLK